MDWANPTILLLILPLIPLLWWFHHRSVRSLSERRSRWLLAVRLLLLFVLLLALAGPSWQRLASRSAVIFVIDHSQSQGESGLRAAINAVNRLGQQLPSTTYVGILSAGEEPKVLRIPEPGFVPVVVDEKFQKADAVRTDLARAVSLACGLFPADASRHVVLIGDGQETAGDLASAARDASQLGITVDVLPVAGEQRPDVRVARVVSDKQRSHEGASIELSAEVESSLDGTGRIRLFENGIEVESRDVSFKIGQQAVETFRRAPTERNLYTYRVRVDRFNEDQIADNDEAMTLVDVRGKPLVLYVEGETDQAHYLAEAMAVEGIQLQVRPPEAIPQTLQELAGYDAIVLSDLPAHQLTQRSMTLMEDYVEQLGGGFLMIGGKQSFGVGGYYRTPIEDILPVKMKAPDKEERYATALALVIDRSGSMSGQKIEICKSAAIATVDLLTPKDHIGVIAFDSSARWIVPMTRAKSKATIGTQVATINSGGGTNIYPGMTTGRQGLAGVKAKVKHMIVLTDGQSGGSGYQQLAAQMHAEGVTISTVAVGSGADRALLQTIAAAGGGTFYETTDPTNIPRIFTQDAMVHMGRLIREEAFRPQSVERHPMLRGCELGEAPELLGYVKTNRKSTAQVPLVTDLGDPLLAHWQYGLGKVTAFTSDCKSRWGALWLTSWPSYNQFWAQVLRETARKSQGHHVDIRLMEQAGKTRVTVDALADASRFANDLDVTADVYFVPAGSLGSAMDHLQQLTLQASGPGRYEADFHPDEAGVYLVRARADATVVSAGVVHNVVGESATGQVDRRLLQQVADLTSGQVLTDKTEAIEVATAAHSHFTDLAPWLLRLAVLLLLLDVCIRRWENVRAIADLLEDRTGANA